jgi:signal transduction histidine kinase
MSLPRAQSVLALWSDGTAARLAELLAADERSAPAIAPRMLEADPIFGFFLVGEMRQQRAAPPLILADAATWCESVARGQASRWLTVQSDSTRDEASRLSASDVVGQSLAIAHAARLVALRCEADPEQAFWAGMLLPFVADDPVVAEWMWGDEEGAPSFAQDAAGELAAHSSELAACRAAGELARREWLAPWPGAWDTCRAVSVQAARLAALEERFAQELEQAKLASLAQFAYGAGHEINNPLANISLRAELLAKSEPDDARRQKLTTIHAQAMRAHEMLADLMLFAKPPRPEPEPCDLVELIADVAGELASTATAQETELALAADAPRISLLADRGQLAVALRAIVVNALEAVERGGRVEITGREQAVHPLNGRSGVELTIRDTGPGIPAEIRTHIFDPFFSGREAGRGLGFGLCKAWRIVQLHAGELTVESPPGAGAAFRLWLPAPRDERPLAEEPAAELRSPHFARKSSLRATD